jgi:hypothetical protein
MIQTDKLTGRALDAAVGIQGLPKAHGVYECIVEEWVSDVRREFRVRDYWSVRA